MAMDFDVPIPFKVILNLKALQLLFCITIFFCFEMNMVDILIYGRKGNNVGLCVTTVWLSPVNANCNMPNRGVHVTASQGVCSPAGGINTLCFHGRRLPLRIEATTQLPLTL